MIYSMAIDWIIKQETDFIAVNSITMLEMV